MTDPRLCAAACGIWAAGCTRLPDLDGTSWEAFLVCGGLDNVGDFLEPDEEGYTGDEEYFASSHNSGADVEFTLQRAKGDCYSGTMSGGDGRSGALALKLAEDGSAHGVIGLADPTDWTSSCIGYTEPALAEIVAEGGSPFDAEGWVWMDLVGRVSAMGQELELEGRYATDPTEAGWNRALSCEGAPNGGEEGGRGGSDGSGGWGGWDSGDRSARRARATPPPGHDGDDGDDDDEFEGYSSPRFGLQATVSTGDGLRERSEEGVERDPQSLTSGGLLVNGSFEQGTAGWSLTGLAAREGWAEEGLQPAAVLTASQLGVEGVDGDQVLALSRAERRDIDETSLSVDVEQELILSNGGTYTVSGSAWMRATPSSREADIAESGASYLEISVAVPTEDGNQVEVARSTERMPEDTWVEFEQTFTVSDSDVEASDTGGVEARPGVAQATLRIEGGNVLLDDLELVGPVPEADGDQELLKNGSFEGGLFGKADRFWSIEGDWHTFTRRAPATVGGDRVEPADRKRALSLEWADLNDPEYRELEVTLHHEEGFRFEPGGLYRISAQVYIEPGFDAFDRIEFESAVVHGGGKDAAWSAPAIASFPQGEWVEVETWTTMPMGVPKRTKAGLTLILRADACPREVNAEGDSVEAAEDCGGTVLLDAVSVEGVRGCGCASGGRGGAVGLLVGLLALVARRREPRLPGA